MSAPNHSSHRRLLAVISPGDGPHLLAPTVVGFRSHRATPHVSPADELASGIGSTIKVLA